MGCARGVNHAMSCSTEISGRLTVVLYNRTGCTTGCPLSVRCFSCTVKQRIHIIGGPGSGKSYIAGKLAERFGILAHDLDDLFWDSTTSRYGVRTDASERDRKLAAIVSGDGWIIEGVYFQWLAPSFDAADFIVALTPSIWLRHWRVVRRFLSRKLGRIPSKRESVTDLWQLLRWSHTYDADNLVRARKFLTEHGRKLITCRTFDDVLLAAETPDNSVWTFDKNVKTKLRVATQNDAEAVAAINLRSIFELCSSAYDRSELYRWVGNRTADNFRKNIELGQIHIAESDGQAVGFIDVVPGEVLAIYVLPGWERKGIGSFLLMAAVEKARIPNRSVMVAASHNAAPFYAKHGFQSVKEVTQSRNGVDLLFTQMEMIKPTRG